MTETPATSPPKRITDLLDSKFMARLDALDIVSRRILQGRLQGERRSKRRGTGAEFADHRPYVIGDDLRFVDWNIFGRLEQLFLKIFLVEQDLSVHVVLDASASSATGEPSKNLAIRRLGAALSYVAMVHNSRVSLSLFADGIIGQLPNMRGRNYIGRMAEFLLGAPCEGPSNFDRACRELTATRTGSGVMIVVSDFFFKEGYEEALRRLISRHYDLYCIQMLSPQEISPELTGDLKLIDVEDFDDAEITISGALMDYYKKNLAAYCDELQTFCRKRGATYALTDSSKPIEPLMLNYLRRLGLLR